MAQETIDEAARLRSEVEQLRRRVAEFEAANRSRERRLREQGDLLLSLMSRGILFRADLQSAVREITEACSDLIEAERVSVWLYDEDCATIRCIDLYERGTNRHIDGQVLNSAAFPAYTASHRRGAVVAATDVYSDPRTRDIAASCFREADSRSLLYAPMWRHEKLGGLLSFETVAQQRSWSPEDEDLGATMAALLSLCFEAQERKRAEEALRDSRQQLYDILEFLPDATFAVDREGRVIAWNRAIEDMTGVPASEMIGKGDFEYAIPFFGKRHPILIDFVFQRQPEQESNYLFIHPSGDALSAESHVCVVKGRLLHLWGKASPIRNTSGEIIGAIESIRDISDIKEIEGERGRLTDILESTSDFVGMAAPDGKLAYVNSAGRRMLGWAAKEDLAAHVIYDVHPAWVYDLIRNEGLPAAMEKGTWQAETAILGGDGTEIPVSQLLIVHRSPSGPVEYLSTVMRDITERRRAEDALRESERRLREVQEMAHLGSWYWDVKTGDVQWSAEVYKTFRLDPNEFTPRIDSIQALSPWPEDHERDRELIRRAMESQEKGNFEQRFFRPDKSIGYYYSTFQGRYDEEGNLIAIVGSVMDITDRKRAEESLAERNRFIESLVNLIPGILYIYDLDNRKNIYCNDGIQRILGYSIADVQALGGQFISTLMHPEDLKGYREEILPRYSRAGDGEMITHAYRMQHRNQEWRWLESIEIVYSRNLDGSPRQVFGVAYDVTERKRAEEEVIRQRRELQQVLDAVSAQIWYLDSAGRVVNCSRVAERSAGVKVEQTRGGTIHTLAPGWDDPERRHQQSLAVARTGQPLLGSVESFRVGNELRWASVDKIPWRDADGAIIGVLAFIYDITDLKLAEAAIRKLNLELEQRVIERTAQLEAANKELEAFTYSVSHDLRAPLRHIDGFARVLAREHAASLNSEGHRLLRVVQEGAQRMGALIDDLLTLSRLGRKPIEKTAIDFEALVREVWRELIAHRDSTRIHLEVGPMPPAYGDRNLLRQVWLNLLDNAIKYTSTRQRSEIIVGSHTTGDGTWYRVQDNGVGFDARFADKLFAVFQRLHREDEFPGTGVGLAIVQRIIHRHGGQVRGQGEIDGGAMFEFTLGE